jgi:hypothetical protein
MSLIKKVSIEQAEEIIETKQPIGLFYTVHITKAIADTYARTKDEARRVIWVKYGLAIGWEPPAELAARMNGRNRFDMSPDHMAEVLNVDRATFHRYRTGFVYGIAERLGWW